MRSHDRHPDAAGGVYGQMLARGEQALGDPAAPGPLSFERALADDEAERWPGPALAGLVESGFSTYHVPRSIGGNLESLEQLAALARVAARRDLSVAVAAGLQIWSQLVWMAGRPEQRLAARDVLKDGGPICLAASERAHGADLLANETRASTDGAGFVLNGEKWPIGGARQARLAFVLARTEERPGPRSLSWLWVGEGELESAACRRLEKVPTIGLRASNLSGLRFTGTALPADALIGARGQGLELALRLFQITRPLAAALSLGAADSALRFVARDASARRLYGRPVDVLPLVEEALAFGFADLLGSEALVLGTVRGLHARPSEMSLASLVAKAVVPEKTAATLRDLASVQGARFFVRGAHADRLFQKVCDDHAAIPIFDGSTAVCLQGLASQLPMALGDFASVEDAGRSARLDARFSWTIPLPELRHEALGLTARGEDDVVRGSAGLADEVAAAASNSPRPIREGLVEVARGLDRVRRQLHARVRGARPDAASLVSTARDYAEVHYGAACFHSWLRNRKRDSFHDDGAWLLLALRRFDRRARLLGTSTRREAIAAVAGELRRRAKEDVMLSLLPVRLVNQALAGTSVPGENA